MLRELNVFETSDGKRFDNEDKAREHVADGCREIIDARLNALVERGKLSRSDTFAIVMAIIPDADAAKTLSAQLARWIDF